MPPPPPPTPYTKESRFRSRERWPCCPSSNLRTNLTPCTTEVQGVPASLGSRPLKSNYQPLKITFKSCRIFRVVMGSQVSGTLCISSGSRRLHSTTTTIFMVDSSSSQSADSFSSTHWLQSHQDKKKMQHYHCSTNSLMYNPDKDCNCPELKSSLGFFGFSFW